MKKYILFSKLIRDDDEYERRTRELYLFITKYILGLKERERERVFIIARSRKEKRTLHTKRVESIINNMAAEDGISPSSIMEASVSDNSNNDGDGINDRATVDVNVAPVVRVDGESAVIGDGDEEADPFHASGYTPFDDMEGSSVQYKYCPIPTGADDGEEDFDDGHVDFGAFMAGDNDAEAQMPSVESVIADMAAQSLQADYERTVAAGQTTSSRSEEVLRVGEDAASYDLASKDQVTSVDDEEKHFSFFKNMPQAPPAPMDPEIVASIKKVMSEMSLPTPPWEKEKKRKEKEAEQQSNTKAKASNDDAWRKVLQGALGSK